LAKYQKLQRDINKLRRSVNKANLRVHVIVEQLMKIIDKYVDDYNELNDNDKKTELTFADLDKIKPDIIISQSFSN
jgi:hypothetical protein